MKHIFIVNPFAGKKNFANNLREQLDNIKNFEYYLFNTRYPGHETELVRKVLSFFPDENIRIYSCGGSGTIKKVLDGIDDFSRIEVAFYPCGLTNDYLKMFSESERKRFLDIVELVYGDVVQSDYIQTTYGRALNTITMGIDTRYLYEDKKGRETGISELSFGYILNTIKAMTHTSNLDMRIFVNGINYDSNYMEIAFFNGICLGGALMLTEPYRHNDGCCNHIFAPNRGFFAFLSLVNSMLKREDSYINKYCRYGKEVKKAIFMKKDLSVLHANMDGEMVSGAGEWELEVVRGGLRFVVPRGVSLK